MSIYKELNDFNIDVSEFVEEELSSEQAKRWNNRVLKKLRRNRPGRKIKYAGAAAVVILAAGISLGTGQVTYANIPIIGGMIEKYLENYGLPKQVDLSAYKEAIGSTATNKYGTLTLDEALVDGGQLFINATFKPVSFTPFIDNPYPDFMTIQMNGKPIEILSMAAGPKWSDHVSTIMYQVDINDLPTGGMLDLHVTLDYRPIQYGVPHEKADHPWTFDFSLNTKQIAQKTTTIQIDRTISFYKGNSAHITRMVASPLSTVIYYDMNVEGSPFKLITESGTEIIPGSQFMSKNRESVSRFPPLHLQSEKYYIVPIGGSDSTPILISPE